MRIFNTLPQTDQHFAHDAPILRIVKWVLPAFLLISSLSVFLGVRSHIEEYLEELPNIIAFLAYLKAYLLFSLAPDALNVILLAYVVRSFLKGYYRDRLGIILMASAGVMLVFLSSYSYRMSRTAAQSLIQSAAPIVEQAQVADIDSTQRSAQKELAFTYQQDRSEVEQQFNSLIQASTQPLEAQLRPLQTQIENLEKSRQPNNTFYINLQQEKLQNRLQPIELQLLQIRKTLVEQKQERLSVLREQFELNKAELKNSYQKDRNLIIEENTQQKEKINGMTQVFSSQFSWMAGYAVFIVLLLTTIREILYHRNGIDLQPIISPFDFQTKPLQEAIALPFILSGRYLINWVRSQYARLPVLQDPPQAPPLKPYLIKQFNVHKSVVEQAEETDIRLSSADYDSLFSESATKSKFLEEKESLNGAYDFRMPAQTTIVIDNSQLKNCQYCGTPFLPNHKKQKYCCEDHRKAAWEEKNGRKLMLRKKK